MVDTNIYGITACTYKYTFRCLCMLHVQLNHKHCNYMWRVPMQSQVGMNPYTQKESG